MTAGMTPTKAGANDLSEAELGKVQGGSLSKLQHDTAMASLDNSPKEKANSAGFVADSFSFGDG